MSTPTIAQHRAALHRADKISLRGLHCVANAGYDAWGRPRSSQPVDIDATLYLRASFTSAAASDSLDASTVHYGLLSKALIDEVERAPSATPTTTSSSTSSTPPGWLDPLAFNETLLQRVLAEARSTVAAVDISTRYPKAAHMGAGLVYTTQWRSSSDSVPPSSITDPALSPSTLTPSIPAPTLAAPTPGITASSAFPQLRGTSGPTRREALHVARLSAPALVGINAVERGAAQMVVVSVDVEPVPASVGRRAFEVEQLVVKTVGESAFGTLEALGEELVTRVAKYFLLPLLLEAGEGEEEGPVVKVAIEKPSAVPRADCPVVEVARCVDRADDWGRRVRDELGVKRLVVPFPLAGRLDEVINSWKQD